MVAVGTGERSAPGRGRGATTGILERVLQREFLGVRRRGGAMMDVVDVDVVVRNMEAVLRTRVLKNT